MANILIVEDEERYRNLYRRIFRVLNVPTSRCHFAEDFESALRWVKVNAHNLQVALVDLKIPRDADYLMKGAMQEVELNSTPLGFDLIRAIREKNRDCEVIIISNYTDERPERKILASLRAEGVWVDSVLHKQRDLDMENQGGIDLLRSYVEPVDQTLALLELQGIYARHARLEKVVRRLCHIYHNLPEQWPMPALLFHGSPGAGKNGWARAAAYIKAGMNREIIFEEESLGAFPDKAVGDSVGAKLFGARAYNGADAAGLFEKASVYSGAPEGRLATEDSVPDFCRSGVAFLDELDSAPPGLIDALLNAMSEGQVKTVGLRSSRIRIGCSLIFASIQGIDLLNSDDAERYERGSQALEAFFNRILPNHIIEVPDLQDLGVQFARDFLAFKAGGDLSIQPSADDLLVEGIESGLLNMRKLSRIVVPREHQARRLTYDDIQRVFGVFERNPKIFKGLGVASTPVDKRLTEEAVTLLNSLEPAAQSVIDQGQRLTRKSLASHFISPSSGRHVAPQRISQMLTTAPYSSELRRLLRESGERWPYMKQMLIR